MTCFNSLARFAHGLYGCRSLYMYVGHVCIESCMIQGIIELSHVHYCYCEAEVRSFNMSIVNVVRLHIVFLKAAFKREVPWNPCPWNPL